MRRIFGTDGARGVANKEINPELAVKIGIATGLLFKGDGPCLIGEDTRISSPMLRSAVASGLASAGVDVEIGGIVPTPAVSLLTRIMSYSCGVVISASHNPIEYNGIKIFDNRGMKLDDNVEEHIEEKMSSIFYEGLPQGKSIGKIRYEPGLVEMYIAHLTKRFAIDLKGLKIAVDSAYGATYYTTPETLKRLGASLTLSGNDPDGTKINVNCGSTHPQVISNLVRESGARIGISQDGDGDRVIFADENGEVVDGDETMVIIGRWLKKKNSLKNDTIIGTVMTNKGIEDALQREGINFVRTHVGDRYVLKKMQQLSAVLGGEQSGHIIFLDESATGDGLITSLVLLSVMLSEGKPLSELKAGIIHYPQVLVNVRVNDKRLIEQRDFTKVLKSKEDSLKGHGRILVRPSGTEPVIRIMVEGEDEAKIQDIANELKQFLEA
jgi:phosphoglucosamine mutase